MQLIMKVNANAFNPITGEFDGRKQNDHEFDVFFNVSDDWELCDNWRTGWEAWKERGDDFIKTECPWCTLDLSFFDFPGVKSWMMGISPDDKTAVKLNHHIPEVGEKAYEVGGLYLVGHKLVFRWSHEDTSGFRYKRYKNWEAKKMRELIWIISLILQHDRFFDIAMARWTVANQKMQQIVPLTSAFITAESCLARLVDIGNGYPKVRGGKDYGPMLDELQEVKSTLRTVLEQNGHVI